MGARNRLAAYIDEKHKRNYDPIKCECGTHTLVHKKDHASKFTCSKCHGKRAN